MKQVILSDNALEVAKSRYFMKDEDWERCTHRVSSIISQNEKDGKFLNKFHELIYNFDFIPGGRILRNCGRPRGSLFNCYHIPIGDSIEEIGQCMKDALVLWSEGGGVGINFSSLRPKGDNIMGKGGISSGLVSFIESINGVADTIESGGSRRAAAIAHVDIGHPEILDFIDAKLTHGKLSQFNISVSLYEEFLDAVDQDRDWEFRFKQKCYGKIKAREIWDKIVQNMIKSAEPGLINWDKFAKNNSWYFSPILGCNPCITGDTLIAVADGRGDVSIKQLVDEGKDVPVFCLNEETNDIEVKMMRNPRITGYNQKILKVTIDDGSIIRCTGNHKFTMYDGTVKEAKDLLPEDQLHHMVKNLIDENYTRLGVNSKSYQEHRLIEEFKIGRKLRKNEVVHHKNKIRYDNRSINLEVMKKSDHNRLHILGDNNPMRDGWWNNTTEYEKDIYRKKMSKSTFGIKNGNYKGFTLDDIIKRVIVFIETQLKNDKSPFYTEWVMYCRINKIPFDSATIVNEGGYKSSSLFYSHMLEGYNLNLPSIGVRNYKKFLKLKNNSDLNIFFEDNIIKVKKNCEHCNNQFIIPWITRERAFCSRTCCNSSISHRMKLRETNKKKQEIRRNQIAQIFLDLQKTLNRDPKCYEVEKLCKEKNINFNLYGKYEKPNEYYFNYFKEVKQYSESLSPGNYKVTKVEEDGYEDVYNGTVDNHHNFYIKTTSIKNTISTSNHYINTPQCGEAVLGAYEVCCLGSLVLPNFITGNINTNWKKLEQTIELGIRFLDNIIDINKYVLKQNDIAAHNSRRIGLGVMGLAEYLFAKKIRYGSERSVQEVERLMRFIRDKSYEASVKLSKEKGAFPKFDSIMYSKSSFIRKLPAQLRMDIKKFGVRNVTANAIAPTGCLVKNTKIKTTNGTKTLNDIFKENDINLDNELKTSNKWFTPKNKTFVKTINTDQLITKLYINGESDTKIITFKDRSIIEGTYNHKVLVLDKNNPKIGIWKKLDELTIDDKVIKLK